MLDTRAAGAERSPGLGGYLNLAARQAQRLAGDYALLAVLDARRAAMRFAWVVSLVLVVAVLLVTAWLAFVTAVIVLVIGDTASWPAALAIGGAINVAGAIGLALWMRSLITERPFAATLRQLRGETPPAPSAPISGGT